jgi:hypothetical protein
MPAIYADDNVPDNLERGLSQHYRGTSTWAAS